MVMKKGSNIKVLPTATVAAKSEGGSADGSIAQDGMEQVLTAIRRVFRATDLHSRHIARVAGLTSSQLILLKVGKGRGAATVGELAGVISLSQATVTTI